MNMLRRTFWIVLSSLIVSAAMLAQTEGLRPKFDAFDVATIKPVESTQQSGRFFRMVGPHRWVATNFTLKNLIALAYDLNPKTISGGPGWIESQHFNIEAVTPGDVQPVRLEQMQMLRALLVDRFSLKFHRQGKEFAIYELTVGKSGSKLKPAAKPDAPPELIGVVYPGKIEVPAKSVTMNDFVAMLQRATLDRPTVNKTGLEGKYDFTLDWAPDETQYGGEIAKAPDDAPVPPLFTAMQEQLGLKLTATHGMVSAMVVDTANKPVEN
jgi:uncharacterized protein (TIGR03435 family)